MKAGIAGAGIMGRLLAFALQNERWDVTVFDQDSKNNCSYAAAGLLTHITELEKNDLIIYQLGHEAITKYWPALLKQMDDDIYFKQDGTLVLSHARDRSELLRLLQMIDNKLKSGVIPAKAGISLDQEQITKLEPQLTKFQEGFFFPDEGQIDCQKVMSALEKKLHSITWHENNFVEKISPRKIELKNKTYDFDIVFDCRGLGAKSVFNDLRGVRGELIWLHAPEVVINRPIRLMHPRYSLYIAPRPNHLYLVGASEIESNDQSEITVRTALELLTAVYSVHPGFCEARIIKTVTQCRPTLTNHWPKIKYADGLIAINGLYRHGYLIAPTLAAEIMKFIQKGFNTVCYPELWEKFTC